MKFQVIVLAVLTDAAAAGYCNYNGCDGESSSSTSAGYCSESEQNCLVDCASLDPNYPAAWCTTGPSPPPSGPGPSPTPGIATTTRYWDCSGGSCACAYVPLGLSNPDDPAHCHSNALFAAPPGNSYGAKFYGTAAVSQALGGGDWLAPACGKCWKVTGTGMDGSISTLVLRGVNYCPPGNPLCNNNPHFDIAAPGFDVVEYSFSNTCLEREADEIEGFTACGRWMIDSQDSNALCDCSKFTSATLRAGCENFLSLQWDNPSVQYEEVTCPPEMVTPCQYNSNGYFDENDSSNLPPDTCYAPLSAPNSPPSTAPVTPSPIPEPPSPTTVPPSPTTVPPAPTPEPQCTLPTQCDDGNDCTVDECQGDYTCKEPRDDACTLQGLYCVNGQCISPTPQPPAPTPQPPSPTPQPPAPTPQPPAPTPQPPSPTPAPPTGTSECCSQTFDKCMDDVWCNASAANCGSCNALWMTPNSNCVARYLECTNNNNCCAPAKCKGGRWYKQCNY